MNDEQRRVALFQAPSEVRSRTHRVAGDATAGGRRNATLRSRTAYPPPRVGSPLGGAPPPPLGAPSEARSRCPRVAVNATAGGRRNGHLRCRTAYAPPGVGSPLRGAPPPPLGALSNGLGLFSRPAALSFAHVARLQPRLFCLAGRKTAPAEPIGLVITGPTV
jgi:hypothetical protein